MTDAPTLPVYWDDVFFEYEAPKGAFNLPGSELLAFQESPPDRVERNQNIKRIIEKTLSE